jgi:hypothetical protein
MRAPLPARAVVMRKGVSLMRPAARRPFAFLLSASVCLSVLAIVATPDPAVGQDVTGALQGTVLSPEGTPEPDVHVIVSGPHLQGTRGTETDRFGFFQFLVLPPGTYELRAGRIGFRPILVRDITVELGRTTAVPTLTLEPRPIQMDSVIVVAPPVSLDPVHTTMGGVIKTGDYESLPVDRDYKAIITILPMANDSHRGDPVNVGGATGLENQYYIDGMNVTDARMADRSTNLPYNFVRTVSVRTGGYEAQYGRALGAVVDAVTYAGTNRFEANVFGLTQPGSLTMDAKGTSTSTAEGATYYEYGARVSGPLVRDRLWYSLALNPRTESADYKIGDLGTFEDKTQSVRFANKLTWRATPSTNLELSVFGDPSTQDHVLPPDYFAGITTILNADPYLAKMTRGGTSAALRATIAPSRSLLFQAAVGRQWDRFVEEPSTERGASEVTYFDYLESSASGGYIETLREDRGRSSASLQGTWTLPRHTLVAGGEYLDIVTKSAVEGHFVARTDSSAWLDDYEAYTGSFHNHSPAVYLQDTWRVTDRLALNAGLRWSGQYLIGESGRTAISFPDEWQPRVGFNWDLGREKAQRVFGSYGRFYLTIPTNMAVFWFVDYTAIYSSYSTDPRQPGAIADDVVNGTTLEGDVLRYTRQLQGLETENIDEFTIGYERALGSRNKVTLRGIRRHLRSDFQYGFDLSRDPYWVLGTPGKNDFDFLPPPKREYAALEVSAEGTWRRVGYRASYVLSRSYGNNPGLFDSDFGYAVPGRKYTFAMPYQAENSSGPLPNDHTHVFKLSTSYRTHIDVTCGAFFTFETGAPVNDFAAGPDWPQWPSFVVPRGSAGRTPALWNLDLRLAYDLPANLGPRTSIQLDVLHVGNPRGTTRVDEWHYQTVDSNGNPATPNPNYKQPTAYQPPMALRLGMEMSF